MTQDTSALFVPGGSRATATMALLGLAALVDAAAVVTGVFQYRLLTRAAQDLPVTEAEAAANDTIYGAVGLLQVAFLIAAGIPFLMWLHRTYRNLGSLGTTGQYSPGWAVGYFFVPILNLFRPYQVLTEIWSGSDPSQHTQDNSLSIPPEGPTLVMGWWGLFLASGFLSNSASRMMMREETTSGLQLATGVMLLADLTSVVAAILAILMVKRIEERQATSHQLTQSR